MMMDAGLANADRFTDVLIAHHVGTDTLNQILGCIQDLGPGLRRLLHEAIRSGLGI
jgi:hypothetical protein